VYGEFETLTPVHDNAAPPLRFPVSEGLPLIEMGVSILIDVVKLPDLVNSFTTLDHLEKYEVEPVVSA
jgi:hypothetical protein